MKVTQTRPVSVSEANDLLAQRSKDSELEYEQAQAHEHSERFSHYKPDQSSKLAQQLQEKNGKIDPETALKLVDISPNRPETLKAILLRNKIELSDEEAEDILKILKE